MAQGSRVHGLGPRSERPLVVSGKGRIGQTTIVAEAAKDGTVVFDLEINPNLFPRLRRIASAYQRYRFTKLDFLVQPMCPSTTGGGWVAGLIPDPLDENLTFDALQATLGSEVYKWWEGMEVPSPAMNPDRLWTSEGENARLYSPGRFVVLAVGTNTDIVNLSVICHWEAELAIPSLETPKLQQEFKSIVPVTSAGLGGQNSFPAAPYFREPPIDRTYYQSNTSIPVVVQVPGGHDTVHYTDLKMNGDRLTWGLITWDDSGQYAQGWVDGEIFYQHDQPEGVLLPKGTILKMVPDSSPQRGARMEPW